MAATAEEAVPASAFAAFKLSPFETGSRTPDGSGSTGTSHVGAISTPSRSGSPPLPPRSGLSLRASLDVLNGRRASLSLSRQPSAALGAAAGKGGPPALWRQSTAVSELVASTMGFSSVADLCGDSYVPPERLCKPKALGEGAFAEVDRAQLLPAPGAAQGEAARTVAVKRLKPHILECEGDCLAFISEARLLFSMAAHPSIVSYIGLGCQDDSSPEAQWRTLYLVQEFASGGTLKKLVLNQMIAPTRKLYSLGDAVRWGTQIAEGLAHLHSVNPMIIHRDLKAENVLLTTGADGKLHAKLADFGLHRIVPRAMQPSHSFFNIKEESDPSVFLSASCNSFNSNASAAHSPAANTKAANEGDAPRQQLQAGRRSSNNTYRMTGRTGAYVYMAPEVMLCKPYNEKVDVFSFGVVLYELLHRKMIVADLMYLGNIEDAEAHAYKVARGYRMPISPDLPQALQQLVRDCWADSPYDRPSMAEVAARLRQVEQSGEVAAVEHQHGPAAAAGCCTVM